LFEYGSDVSVDKNGKEINLAPSVNTVQLMAICSVPKTNAPISSSTSRHKETALVRGPSNGLHCSSMLSKPQSWLLRVLIPYQELII